MSELFTQNFSDKPLFHTDTDISESLHNQVDEASNGEELLDNTEKQAESLLSNDDYVSETKNSILDDRDDVEESLSSPVEGNRKYITGTNTPRASRSNAYYELLCNQQTNGYRSPAMRGTTAAAHGITSASGLVNYQEDFATDAAQDVGVHGAAAGLILQETFLGTAAEDVGILGSYAVKGIKDVQDGTRTAEEILHTGGDVLRMELGSSAVQIGSAGARTALHYAETFSTSADDFADRAPGIISNTGFQTGHSVIKVARFFAHPVKALVSIGRTALICGAIVLLLLIIGLLGQMSGTTTTSVLCADRPEDIQQLIESINTYRNEAATDELRRAFRNDVDPNGNPYGYDTLTGQRSNNMQHGVTWSYANGIYNDTAEIISMAAVYYQQDWPSSAERYQFECEQNELNTDDGASFHLTVTDMKNPDTDLSTPSHDENTTVQRAASYNAPAAAAPSATPTPEPTSSQPVQQSKKSVNPFWNVLDFLPIVFIGAGLFWFRQKSRRGGPKG